MTWAALETLKQNFTHNNDMKRFIFVLISLYCVSGYASASTIWCNPANSGLENGSTKASGYSTLWEALAVMSSGDEIVIANGDWSTGYAGMTIDSSGHLPPSGTSYSNMTTIRAEDDWGAKIPTVQDGGGDDNNYILIQGIIFSSNTYAHSVYKWHHSKFIRCGFFVGKLTGNESNFSLTYGTFNLVEECIAWGGGRYKFLDYHGDNNIYRRCVARHDWYAGPPETSGQESSFRGYGSTNSAWLNCISIDSDREEYQSPISQEDADFWIGDQSGGGGNVIIGSIVIRGMYQAFYFGATDTGTDTVRLEDSMALGPSLKGTLYLTGALTYGTPVLTVNKCLFYMYNKTDQHASSHSKGGGSATITNTVFKDVGSFLADAPNYNYYYNTSTGDYGVNSINADPSGNGMLYPVRTEAGSNLATAGIGPTILKKIGFSGTTKGQSGWNTVTNENIWPFPNEAKIKELMSTTVDGVSGVYGFAAGTSLDGSPQTLTKYIWEYFGNQIPADIYGSTSSAISPTSFSIPGGVTYGIVQ